MSVPSPRVWSARRLASRNYLIIGTILSCGVVAANLAAFALIASTDTEWQPRAQPPVPGNGKGINNLLPPGSEAPLFALPDVQTGEKVRLRDFRGDRPVVLMFGSFG